MFTLTIVTSYNSIQVALLCDLVSENEAAFCVVYNEDRSGVEVRHSEPLVIF